jgi:hypothetical protein
MPLNPDAAALAPRDQEAAFDTRDFTVTCMGCPLQITGHVDGFRFYFRARHDKWRLEVPDAGGMIIAAGDTDDFTVGQAVDAINTEMSLWLWGPVT